MFMLYTRLQKKRLDAVKYIWQLSRYVYIFTFRLLTQFFQLLIFYLHYENILLGKPFECFYENKL